MWNSRSQKLIGLSMSHVEQSSLSDVYQVLDSNLAQQTSYILQFLWRDLTSDFDIIGPYFTYSKTMDSKFVLSCVLETIKLFHLHGLSTMLLVCDGASTNLSTLKASHGQYGAYPIGSNEPDKDIDEEGTEIHSRPSSNDEGIMNNYLVRFLIVCFLLFIDKPNRYEISPFMVNPYDPPNPIFWLICPTHQVYIIIYY